MSAVSAEKMKPCRWLKEKEICNADKSSLLKIMKLDPRNWPRASELLQDELFREHSDMTAGWYSKYE